jgi:hypothetical protein
MTQTGEIEKKLTFRPPGSLWRNISLILITNSVNAVYSRGYLNSLESY